MAKYSVIDPFSVYQAGVRFHPEEIVEMSAKDAASLVEDGVIQLVTKPAKLEAPKVPDAPLAGGEGSGDQTPTGSLLPGSET